MKKLSLSQNHVPGKQGSRSCNSARDLNQCVILCCFTNTKDSSHLWMTGMPACGISSQTFIWRLGVRRWSSHCPSYSSLGRQLLDANHLAFRATFLKLVLWWWCPVLIEPACKPIRYSTDHLKGVPWMGGKSIIPNIVFKIFLHFLLISPGKNKTKQKTLASYWTCKTRQLTFTFHHPN